MIVVRTRVLKYKNGVTKDRVSNEYIRGAYVWSL